MRVLKHAVVFIFAGLPAGAWCETFYELAVGASRYSLSITRKRGEDFKDESDALNISLGAYRSASEKSAWGAVIEYIRPVGREDELPGDGSILGFRPLNYLRYVGGNTNVELYAGAAQYEWRKTANGYYFGTSIRYEMLDNRLGLGLDVKYYQDLAFDSPEGDDIVDGFNPGLKLFYRFE